LEKARALLRQSQGEDSRKPIAIRANQAIQRARSRAKAFFKAVARRRQQETHSHSHRSSHQRARSRALKAVYAKKKRTILVEISNIPKKRPPPPLDRLKSTGKPKRSTMSANPSKNHAGSLTEPLQARNA
jgi:hypothetical protein